ncbi:MAG: tetratricopeptide repeat protein [Planctomycetota bacterium]|jgi:tetratricopeptide (TPR) repeat protein
MRTAYMFFFSSGRFLADYINAMSKADYTGLVISSLLIVCFLGLLVLPQLIEGLYMQRPFYHFYDTGDYDRAEEFLIHHIEKHPDSTWALRMQYKLYREQSRYGDSYDAVLKALELDAENPHLWLRRAFLATRLGNAAEVYEAAKTYDSLGGDLPDMHAYLGWAFFSEHKFADAEKEYLAYLEAYPDHPYTLYALADIAYARGDYEKARTLCERSLEGAPDYADAGKLMEMIIERLRQR